MKCPVVEAVAVLLMQGGKILTVFNPRWGAFTLPMSKRKQFRDEVVSQAPRLEEWDRAAARVAAEVMGRTFARDDFPTRVCEIKDFEQSDADGVWKLYTIPVFRLKLSEGIKLAPGIIAEWMAPADFKTREPLNPHRALHHGSIGGRQSAAVSREVRRRFMAHDVFISYAHEDKLVADAVCATLESHGVRCWIAPRDVLPGKPYPEAIEDAVAFARLMVVVFSQHAARSPALPWSSKKLTRRTTRSPSKPTSKAPAASANSTFRARLAGVKNVNSHASDRQSTDTSRSVYLMLYSYTAGGDISLNAVTLAVRYPEDVRRERVQFTLEALDVF